MASHPQVEVLGATLCAGAVGSAWLLWVCGHKHQTLLQRQLFHQAAANLIFCSAALVVKLWAVVRPPANCFGDPDDQNAEILRVAALHGLFMVSCASEVHIAAGIAAAAYHSPLALERVRKTVPLVWVLGLGLDLAYMVQCFIVGSIRFHDDPIGAAFVIACLVCICVLTAFTVVCLARTHSPHAAVRRAQRRAMVYPPLFFVTAVPAALVTGFGPCSQVSLWLAPLEDSYGVLAAFAYFFVTAGCRCHRAQGTSAGSSVSSHTVGFEVQVEVVEVRYGSWRKSNQWSDANCPSASRANEQAENPTTSTEWKLWDALVGCGDDSY